MTLTRTTLLALRGILVTVAGIAGAACIAWFVLAPLLGLSMVVVTTGSMSPSLPAGGAAVVVPVPADELKVGDVVTVPRPGRENSASSLPVTHRIVAIDAVAGDASSRSLILRGDANDTPDRQPYVVSTAQRMIVGAPVLGNVIIVLREPAVTATLTVLIAGYVAWSLWPVRRKTVVNHGDQVDQVDDADSGSTVSATCDREHSRG
jgi:signal peptidase